MGYAFINMCPVVCFTSNFMERVGALFFPTREYKKHALEEYEGEPRIGVLVNDPCSAALGNFKVSIL